MIHDRVTDVGTGVDTAVRRISTVYSINGQVERLTSWDNPAVGNGSIVNEVRYEYNQYGLLGKEYSNPVGGAGMLKYTQYFYDANMSGEYFTNGLRPIGCAYPGGDTVTYFYGQTGLADDLLNRPVSVLYNNVVQATYEYQGLQTPITTTYPVPNLSLDYSNALDVYNRIVKQNWKNSNGESVVDIQHGYDRSGNRLNRTDAIGGTAFNEQYSYDGMNQLINKSMKSSFERFHYDATGNHVQTTTDSAVETQTFNKANEIIAINNNSNAVSNDRNGNMTRISGIDLRYDAWNRLVSVTHNGLTVTQYQYNALNHRVIKTTPFETRYYYFNRNWQCLEEYANNSASPDITYVWGMRYIDDMVCRIRSSETLYSIADANWNTVALANSSGNIVERYSYDAFGTRHIYDASFNERVASNYFWTRAFTGQVLDPDTGLMLYRNRYYSPSLGRFITRDPIGYEGDDVNLYRYVKNASILLSDEEGLEDSLSLSQLHLIKNYSVKYSTAVTEQEKIKILSDFIQDWSALSGKIITLAEAKRLVITTSRCSTDKNDKSKKTCFTEYPGYTQCTNFSSCSNIGSLVSKIFGSVKLHINNKKKAEKCGRGGGWHYMFSITKNGRKTSGFSALCCNCCDDISKADPRIAIRCKITKGP